MLLHQKPDYLNFRVFGCTCYPLIRPYRHSKLNPKSVPCTYAGYSPVQEGLKQEMEKFMWL